ncbi:insecticidal delta-endotoxin Cry8Ea1 family protein [Bacillus thuringiensis]|uniref:insecticidal delta-endotoxin Cry8Ea1 family protein n=1 Tax=Bacillus thuringiensis TaxID=1428 RepID=UPI002FFFC380
MKYKNRKHAKRKYKQALLATVATMTLGVSTLGSTASVFAEEGNTSELHRLDAADKAKKAAADNRRLIDKPSSEVQPTLTNYIKMIEEVQEDKTFKKFETVATVGKQVWDNLQKIDGTTASIEPVIRSLAIMGAAYIPGVGSLVSGLLSTFWPETGASNQLTELKKELEGIMDQKITDKDFEDVSAEVKGLTKELKELDDSLNGKFEGLYFGTPSEANRMRVSRIQGHFNRLSEIAAKKDYAKTELPLFTMIAITQSNLINVLEKSGLDKKRFNYTEDGLKNILAPMKKEREYFKNHIEKTYKAYEVEQDKKIAAAQNAKNKVAELGKKMAAIPSPGNLSSDSPIMHEYESKVAPLRSEIEKSKPLADTYDKLVKDKKKYYSLTQANAAYQLVREGKEINLDDLMKLANEEKSKEKPKEEPKEEQKTGWYKDPKDGKYYYYSDGRTKQKNYVVFRGNMVTGWVQIDNQWYYLNDSLKTNYKGEPVQKGEMITGWYHHTDGKYYYLKENGTMVKNDTIKIDGVDSRFDENGVWGGGKTSKSSNDKSTLMDGK